METAQTAWVGVGLFGAFIGFAVGSFCEWMEGWRDKLRMLTAALGGALGTLTYFLIWTPWTIDEICGFHPVVLLLAALIGGLIGWVHGPKKTDEERCKASVEAHREALGRDGLM